MNVFFSDLAVIIPFKYIFPIKTLSTNHIGSTPEKVEDEDLREPSDPASPGKTAVK